MQLLRAEAALSCHMQSFGIEFTLERNWLKFSQKFISVANVIFISLEKLFTPRIKTGEGMRVMEEGLKISS